MLAGPFTVTGKLTGWLTCTTLDSGIFDTAAHNNVYRAAVGGDFSYNGPSSLVLSANGVLTYTGPTKEALVNMSMSVFATLVPGGSTDCGCGIDHNGNLVGLATLADAAVALGVGVSFYDLVGEDYLQLHTIQKFTLANGDTLKPAFAKSNGGVAEDFTFGQLTLGITLQ